MKNRIFTGAGVAIITPMNPDMSVNYAKMEELIEFQIKNGTDAIIVCGTTGESSTLTHEEHCEVIRFTIEKSARRVPVIAGTGSNDTTYCIELSKEAEAMGADGILVVTPYYNKTSQRGLIEHFRMVAESVTIPMIVYSVAGRTGLNITPKTCLALSKIPNIVAIKEASGNISQVAQIAHLCGDELTIYTGCDDMIVPTLSLGGAGVISVISNIMPRETHDICQHYFDGNTQESTRLQLHLLDFINKLFIDVNPVPIKEAMNQAGWEVGPCRLPLYEMDEASIEILKETMKQVGLIR